MVYASTAKSDIERVTPAAEDKHVRTDFSNPPAFAVESHGSSIATQSLTSTLAILPLPPANVVSPAAGVGLGFSC
jgi:hypothetical protein